MDEAIKKQIKEDETRAHRRAERAHWWKQRVPLVAKIFRLNADTSKGLWIDDETLDQPVLDRPLRLLFAVSTAEELPDLKAASQELVRLPYRDGMTISFQKPKRPCEATMLATDNPKLQGKMIYVY